MEKRQSEEQEGNVSDQLLTTNLGEGWIRVRDWGREEGIEELSVEHSIRELEGEKTKKGNIWQVQVFDESGKGDTNRLYDQ